MEWLVKDIWTGFNEADDTKRLTICRRDVVVAMGSAHCARKGCEPQVQKMIYDNEETTGYEWVMKKKKMLKRSLLGIAVLFIVFISIICVMFRHELKTLSTLKEKNVGVYTMTYDGDYGFDEFLKTGAKCDSDVEAFVTKRLLKGLPIDLNISEGGCTAFVFNNEEGDIIYARNFDFPYSPFVQLFTNPDSGYASVSTVNLSFAGYDEDYLPTAGISFDNFLTLAAPFLPFDGMNEKGVCMALLAVPEADMEDDPDKVTLNTTTVIRLVLDKAASVEEAVELLKNYNIYFSGDITCHFLIADATGKSVLVEYYDGGLQVVESDTDYQIATNFIAYNGVNIGEGFTEFERYDAVEEVLQKNRSITMEECQKLLNTVGVYSEGIDKLQWSVIYNLTDKTGRIWPHRDPDKSWDFTINQ